MGCLPDPPSTLRVLVVDDDELIRRVMTASLDGRAHVVGLASAMAALARLQTERFDVVLSDAELGDGVPSGQWLLAEVARRWPAIRRILMSATKQDTKETFVLKPVGADLLFELMGVSAPSS
jgi:CheY-like chemotaxis protein